jgi:hypothetical protein
MNQFTVLLPYDLIERAFEQIDIASPSANTVARGDSKLYANPISILEAAIGDAWLKIQTLVTKCARQGKQFIQEQVSDFMSYVEATTKELGSNADNFRLRLLEKIQEIMCETFDLMLKALRTEIMVGHRKLVLKSIDLEQKLTYTASLEVSLTSLCEFAGGGELTVKGAYEAE